MASSNNRNKPACSAKKYLKNIYSKGELVEVALAANHFIAHLAEELGGHEFMRLYEKMKESPQPNPETMVITWVIFDHNNKMGI